MEFCKIPAQNFEINCVFFHNAIALFNSSRGSSNTAVLPDNLAQDIASNLDLAFCTRHQILTQVYGMSCVYSLTVRSVSNLLLIFNVRFFLKAVASVPLTVRHTCNTTPSCRRLYTTISHATLTLTHFNGFIHKHTPATPQTFSPLSLLPLLFLLDSLNKSRHLSVTQLTLI